MIEIRGKLEVTREEQKMWRRIFKDRQIFCREVFLLKSYSDEEEHIVKKRRKRNGNGFKKDESKVCHS